MPLDAALAPDAIVQLERERKLLIDAVKLTAYRAKIALARIVEPLFARHDDEARKFLKTIFSASADIIPDQSAGRLTVRFHGLASPRATGALAELCTLVNATPSLYPAPALELRFEAPTLQEALRHVRSPALTVAFFGFQEQVLQAAVEFASARL